MQLSESYRYNAGRSEGLLFTPDHELCKKWKNTFMKFINEVWISINEKIDYEGDELVNFIKREDTESIDLRSVLAQSAANVLLQTLLFKRHCYSSQNEEINKLISLVYDTTRDTRFGIMVFMPWLKFLPSMSRFQDEVKSRHSDCIRYFRKLLHE